MRNYMNYTYGVSSNCQADDLSFQVGYGECDIPTIDYVGNDLDKIEKELTKTLPNDGASALRRAATNCSLDGMFARRDHNYVGTRAIQHYLGHKNIEHTVRYTELAADRFNGFWKV